METKITVRSGKTVLINTDMINGDFTVTDSSGRKIGSGGGNTGGKINYSTGSKQAQMELTGLHGASAMRGALNDSLNGIRNGIENANINTINSNATEIQKNAISSFGYGNKIEGTTNNAGAGAEVGGKSGWDWDFLNIIPDKQETNPNYGSDGEHEKWNEENNKDPKTTSEPYKAATVASQWSEAKSARYPSKYLDSSTDFVKFDIIQYKPQKNLSKTFATEGTGRPSERLKIEKPEGRFFLPIPKNAGITNTVDWGPDRLNPIQAGVAGLTQQILGGEDVAGAVAGELGNNSDDLIKLIRSEAAKTIVGGANILTRTTGAVLNSNLELFFTGPGLRAFNFQYRLTPRDDRESLEIKKIVRMCKRGMAARIMDKNLFLYTPHIFKIAFMFKGKPHPFMNKFKPCALKSFEVNFTPDNAYMTYDDGSPIAYSLNFGFQEIEPIYDADYSDGDGADGMGF